MNNEALALRPNSTVSDALSVAEILNQKALIQDAMKSAMQDGQHFGKIPGCGDKPTLLQPGAQTILLLFRMNPDYDVQVVDMERGHREYRIKCSLTNTSGSFIGAGVGSCSTMEGKWRFRVAPKTLTDRQVPKDYWDLRKSDPAKAQELLGGKGFSPKKNDAGTWMIAEGTSDKVEHDNPADYYNTCLKMAKKRALVDATLTRTAASDIFTQDIEDLKENLEAVEAPAGAATPPPLRQKQETQSEPPPQNKTAPMANPGATIAGVTTCDCALIEYKVAHSKPDAAKPWTAYFCKFSDGASDFEAGTFDKKIGETLDVLKGQQVTLSYKPGKRPGTFEIVTIGPAEEGLL